MLRPQAAHISSDKEIKQHLGKKYNNHPLSGNFRYHKKNMGSLLMLAASSKSQGKLQGHRGSITQSFPIEWQRPGEIIMGIDVIDRIHAQRQARI